MRTTAEVLRDTQRQVNRLTRALGALRQELARRQREDLVHAVRRRGLTLKRTAHDGCLRPRGPAAQAEYYRLLRHYSFRLLMRDVIKHRHGFGLGDLLRYCSAASAQRYLQWLHAHRLVRRVRGRFELVAEVPSFGPTLEWFVAMALEREFGIPCAANVRFDAATGGGDYDVIGFRDGLCVYVETKSSPPRNIEPAQIRAFLNRLSTLRPDVAIFLNDTQLRMADKIVPLFEAELRRQAGRHARPPRIVRLSGELFRAGNRLFITNAHPDLVGNIGACLAYHLRRGH